MNANDLIKLGGSLMSWLVAMLIFILSVVLVLVALIMATEVGIICYKEILKNVRKQ